MKRCNLPLFLLLMIGLTGMFYACSNQAGSGKLSQDSHSQLKSYFNSNWAMHKLWDDGLAEVATYDAERVVYKQKRMFEYTLITVKEDFNQAHNVKTDDHTRSDLFPVMKINEFCRIETENYPYHYLTSVFIRRDNPLQLHKLTTSSQEWCGNTFKSITNKGSSFNLHYNSYFDEEGEGNYTLQKDLLLEDQLVYSLRSLQFAEGMTFNANVLETQQTNRALKPTVYSATITVNETAADARQPSWLVTVQLDAEKQNRYLFAKEYPNQLLSQHTWDGRNLYLKDLKRAAYWER